MAITQVKNAMINSNTSYACMAQSEILQPCSLQPQTSDQTIAILQRIEQRLNNIEQQVRLQEQKYLDVLHKLQTVKTGR